MSPCKHLDYTPGKYAGCMLCNMTGFSIPVRYWERSKVWTEGGNPRDVQFCKLRGRINDIFSCYNPGEMSCYEAETADIKTGGQQP